MPKWPSDKELVEIYRKGSEQHDFSYDANAWADLERMLDKERKRRFIWIFLAGFLFLSVGIYISFIPQKETQIEVVSVSNNDISPIEGSDEVGINVASPVVNSNGNSLNDDVDVNLTAQNNKAENSIISEASTQIIDGVNYNETLSYKAKVKSVAKNSNREPSSLSNPHSSLGNPTVSASKIIATALADNHELDTEGLKNKNFKNSEHFSNESPINIVTESKLTHGVTLLPLLSPELLTLEFQPLEMDNTDLTIIEAQKVSFHKTRLWLNTGIESSWTSNGEFSSLDFALGVQLTHQLNRKLGLSIGVNYINDFYIAEEGDYNAGFGDNFWPNGEEPIYTAADCKMLEISFGGKYYFKDMRKSGLAIGASLTSNIMLSEAYEYHFEEEINNFGSKWTTSNVTFLSSLHIQPSYQLQYGANGMLDFGPYFKMPLQGIGHGGVLLSSFGFRASIALSK